MLGDLFALVQAQGLVSRQSDFDGVHEYLHREVLPAALLDLFDHVHDEAGAVLHALRAVLVVALVPEARQEAVEQVVGRGVDLDAVPAGLLQAHGPRGEPIDQLLDLVDGEDVRRLLVVHVEGRGKGHGGGRHGLAMRA